MSDDENDSTVAESMTLDGPDAVPYSGGDRPVENGDAHHEDHHATSNSDIEPHLLSIGNLPKQPPNFSAGRASKHDKDKLMMSEGIIPIQSGTNKWASQRGQSAFGATRDVIDKVKANSNLKEFEEDVINQCREVLRIQCGTNKYASQKGHTGFGAPRDVNYHWKGDAGVEELPEDKLRLTDGIIRLQMGTNKLASQAGYTAFGMPRGVHRKDNQDQDPESQGFIHRQICSNKYASQAGMTDFGMPRHQVTNYKDEQRGDLAYDEATLPKQTCGSMGGSNQGGMTGFGAFRNTTQSTIRHQDRLSQGCIPFQMGISWGDSQAGKTGFGMPRQVKTDFIDDNRPELPEELARDKHMPKWTIGSAGGACQSGMTAMGMPRDVKGLYLRRLW